MQKTVLIADDYADIRSMAKFMIESFGYRVIEARDGFEATVEARRGHPDLILMDIAMPVMNGITAATLIRDGEHGKQTPIIALTAFGKDYLARATDFGFDEVVQKPIEMEEMRQLLRFHLGDDSTLPQT